MFSQLSLFPLLKFHSVPRKGFSSEVQKTDKPVTPSSSGTSETPKDVVKVSAFRKRMFVMVGLFKRTKDIPNAISAESMGRNMDKFRVRFSIILMGLGALGAITSIVLAKGVVEDLEEEREKRH